MCFDIKYIRRDQTQRRSGEACRAEIENTKLVSVDIKFMSIKWQGLPTQFDVLLVEPDKFDIKRQLHGFIIIMHY